MIVSCPSCDSKYQVADDKVAGNVLRTRCKACGSQILVDGTIPPGPKNDEDEDDVTRIMRPEDRPDVGESQPPPSGNRWTVHLGESDTRPMTANEIVQAFVNGTLSEDVSVWKSGMASWASVADVPELMAAIEKTGRRAGPSASGASASSKPPPPVRAASTATGASPRTAPTNGPSRTSKPPPPARPAAPSSVAKSSAVKASPVVAISKRVENTQSTLDPNASSGDFYSKLLNKVGASKSKSSPPAAVAEAKPVNRPRSTMPPPARDIGSVAATRNSPGRASTVKKEPVVANVQSNLDPEAAPGDFYAKILAKVRPQTIPPTGSDPKPPGAARTTLPPPTWGAIGNQPENYAQSHPPSQVPASSHPVAASPIRVLGSAPGQTYAAAGNPAAAEAIDIPVNVDEGVGDDDAQLPGGQTQTAPMAVRRTSPSPPKRPDPVIPVDIQLPPMGGNAPENRTASQTVVVSASTPPPAADSKPPASVEPKPEVSVKPAIEVHTDNTSPGLRAYREGRRKRFAGTFIAIVTVGLACMGGGIAATVYWLKSSNKNANPAVPSASAVAGQTANSPANASAAPTAASSSPNDGLLDADELARSGGRGAANAQAMRAYAGRRPAHAGAVEDAPGANDVAAAAKSQVPPPAQTDSNLPSWLEAAQDTKSKNAKTAKTTAAAAPPPAEKPTKASGPPFNREAALAILGIAASQAPSCKRPGGPTGNGKALVTFDTDGQVVIANIVGDDIAGTPVARCVAGIFQRVKVAPFSGERATVSKPFSIPP